MKKLMLSVLIILSMPLYAFSQSLQGTYKLVTFDVQIEREDAQDLFGKAPHGYLIITPTRMMTIITKEGRNAAHSPEEKSALVDSLISYTGPYRIEGKKFITDVDVSWSEAWTGTKQARTWTVNGSSLTLVTDPAPYLIDPSKTDTARLVWEKIE